MKYLGCITGLSAGFLLGSLLLAHPLAAGLGRTTVAWSADSCPAGNYSITAIATHNGSGQNFEFRSNAVLPRTEVAAGFDDLPTGHYFVRVEARRGDGLTFFSSQAVSVGASGSETSMDGRRRTVGSREITGRAAPRTRVSNTSTSPVRPASAFQAARGASRVSEAPAAPPVSVTVQQLLVRLSALRAAGQAWQRLDLVDADEDGEPDAVTVEFVGGATISWALPRRFDR
jgi:hypothetical protein